MPALRRLLIAAAASTTLATSAVARSGDPVATSLRQQYALVKGNLVASAERMPAEHYGFRPTPDVRSFGELIGHVANAQYAICAGLRGTASPQQADLEKSLTSKADLVAAITAAFAYCDAPYASATDAAMGESVDFFGGKQSRHYPMAFALVHGYEHYGNIVTYMRLKGIVPPSSQGN